MIISDIINPLLSVRDQTVLALRIRRCSPMIKADIRNWKESGEFPTRTVVLEAPSGVGKMTLSMDDLVNLYNMKPLSAFFFMDELLKASTKDDKRTLADLLGQLESRSCVHNGNITPELLDSIKENQPGLWAEYQTLLKTIEAQNTPASGDNPLNDEI